MGNEKAVFTTKRSPKKVKSSKESHLTHQCIVSCPFVILELQIQFKNFPYDLKRKVATDYENAKVEKAC